MVICTGTVYFVDLQSRFVDSKAQLFQSSVAKQYSSCNFRERRKDQWFLDAKFVPGLGLNAIH